MEKISLCSKPICHSIRINYPLPKKKIAEYFLSKGNTTLNTATSYELAEYLNIGQATVIRFAKKLGYSGYREMLMDISYSCGHEEEIQEINKSDSIAETNRKIQLHYQHILDITINSNSEETFSDTIKLLKNARHIFCFGIGQSYLLAEHLSGQLNKLRFTSITHYNALSMYLYLQHATNQDIVFLFSAKGETPEILNCAKIARQAGIKVISCTGLYKNKLYDLSDIIFKTPAYDSRTSLSDGTRRVSQMAIIDMIYLNIIRSDFKKYSSYMDEAETLFIKYR